MFDPAIKLFGKTIPLPETQMSPPLNDQNACGGIAKSEASDSFEEESCKPNESSATINGTEDKEDTSIQEMVDAQIEKGKFNTDSDGQEKVLKKPDKIVPCPRCNSLDTKFCYYNNYNVNQPRHFCKNCQRYWTAGGTMRNVPVGAGRRKNKHIALQYHRHVMMSSDGIPTAQVETSDMANHKVKPCDGFSTPLGSCSGNGSVFEFGSDAPLCESMATVLNLDDKKRKTEMGVIACAVNKEEPSSCGSSVSASTCSNIEMSGNVVQMEQHGMAVSDGHGPPPQNPLQCYAGPPWVYPWNSGWNMAAMSAGRCSADMFYRMDSCDFRQVRWGSTPMVASPTFCTPSLPFQFVPPSYWGGMSGAWASGGWSMPWNGCNGAQSPSSSSVQSGCSSNFSPTLGKHSRDADMQAEDRTEKCLWAPKTLRIDNPDATAKSSIWDTLGINPCKNEPILKGGIFKAFQPKSEVNYSVSDTTDVLQANPAALSRSQTFQEST